MIRTVANITATPALSAEGGGRDIVISHTGRLWVVYSDKPAGINFQQIYAAYSDNDGITWVTERVTFDHDINHHFFPALAIDSMNNLHLVYTSIGRQPYANRWGTFYRRRTLIGWQDEETVALLDVAAPGQDYPAIAIDGDDVPHVVWAGLGWGVNAAVKNIQYRARTGGVWGDVEPITDKDTAQDCPSLAIDSTGRVHVAWTGKSWGVNPTFGQACYAYKAINWEAENVTDDPSHHGSARIALDSGDNPHLVYYSLSDDGIFYTRKSGGAWAAREQVSHEGASIYGSGYPSIALDRSNNVHVVWASLGQGLSEDYANYWYRKKASSWLNPAVLTNQDDLDQWCASLLWANYPENAGVKTNVLPDLQKVVWEYLATEISYSETPVSEETKRIKVSNMANHLVAARII